MMLFICYFVAGESLLCIYYTFIIVVLSRPEEFGRVFDVFEQLMY